MASLSFSSVFAAIEAQLKDMSATFDIGSVAVTVDDNNGLHIQLGLKPKG